MSADKRGFNVRFPLGTLDLLKQHAREQNQTVSALINSALLARLGLSEWPDHTTVVQKYDHNPAPACIICGDPLPEGKMRYCSDECKREGHRRSVVESLRRKRLSQSHPSEN